MVLEAEPSMLVHVSPGKHVLVEEVQKNPVLEVQNPVVPHKHAAPFVVMPLVCVQAGAARQRQ